MREHEIEPIPGLPERLPAGETILWQGAPRWQTLARRTFQLPWLAAYFGLLVLARLVLALQDGASPVGAAIASLWLVLLGAVALGLLALLGWLSARTTMYTITNRRVVMRIGIALSMTLNLPFTAIEAAALRLDGDGSGDVTLTLLAGERVGYLLLWPHARPWRFARAEPMLRGLPDAAAVAATLSAALAATVPGTARPRAAAEAVQHAGTGQPQVVAA